MSTLLKRSLVWVSAASTLALFGTAGCAGTSTTANPGPVSPTVLDLPDSPTASPDATVASPPKAPATTTKAPSASSWPSPEDCVSYNPQNITVSYEAGIYSVKDGSKVVMRLHGGPGEVVGEQGLALAKRYSKHCYLGRDNTREDKNSYVFDYWRSASGMNPAIPEEEDACSSYDKNNLTVEDMGDGYGWRVKDHDHVLHVFDNESDARNGKLVLGKYNRICFLGGDGDSDDPDRVSYLR